jgi:hypothetical protein
MEENPCGGKSQFKENGVTKLLYGSASVYLAFIGRAHCFFGKLKKSASADCILSLPFLRHKMYEERNAPRLSTNAKHSHCSAYERHALFFVRSLRSTNTPAFA